MYQDQIMAGGDGSFNGKMDLGEVYEIVRQDAHDKYDRTVSLKEMYFESATQVVVNGEAFAVSDQAANLLCGLFKRPSMTYLRHCSPELQAANLEEWRHRRMQYKKDVRLRFKGNVVRAFFSERYAAYDNLEMIRDLINLGVSENTKVDVIFDPDFIILKIADLEKGFSVRENDDMHLGLTHMTSETGLLSIIRAVFFWRQWCSNGAVIVVPVFSRSYRHTINKVQEARDLLADDTRHLMGKGRLLERNWQMATEIPIESVEDAIADALRVTGLPQRLNDVVSTAFMREPGNTQFHAINALSRAAHESSVISQNDRMNLEAATGKLLYKIGEPRGWQIPRPEAEESRAA